MIFSLNPSEILAPIKTLLDADTTIQGASYLNKATLYTWTASAPTDATLPYLVLTILPFTPDDMQMYRGEIRVFAHFELLSNGQINPAADRTLARAEAVLNNVSPTLSGGSFKPLNSLGIIPSFSDSAGGKRSRGVLRLDAFVGKDG